MDVIYDFMQEHYLGFARYLFVVLALLILFLLYRRLRARDGKSYLLAVLDIDNGSVRLPIMHYETTIGRSRSCDVVIPSNVISRQHAVLSMTEQGRWRIADTKSLGGIFINGNPLTPDTLISIGDEIALAGVKMVLMPATSYDAKSVVNANKEKLHKRIVLRKSKRTVRLLQKNSVLLALLLLNIFQTLACYQIYLIIAQEFVGALLACFAALALSPWIYLGVSRLLGISNTAAEATGFFLSTIGICTTASANPQSLYKQLGAYVLGILLFCSICLVLRNLHLVMKLRPFSSVVSLLTLAANIILGVTLNGQRNWIDLGFISIQPSEFVKILFVFSGAATLEWLLTTRNLTVLTVYAVGCIGFLFLMGDFGTALIFFVAFLTLVFMTSGDIRAIVLFCVSAGLGGLLILSYKPYIWNRFSAWRHVWEHMSDNGGFQQTRTLIAIASGGLLGLGGGNGFLKHVYAADTDIVFGVICEEWGLIIGLTVIACYTLLLYSAIRSHKTTRSSYYVIAACTAAAIFVFQASLNIFGSTDVLPLTGVTLPFISNGGSSMAASWGLLSFITAARNYAKPNKAKLLTEPVTVQSA